MARALWLNGRRDYRSAAVPACLTCTAPLACRTLPIRCPKASPAPGSSSSSSARSSLSTRTNSDLRSPARVRLVRLMPDER